MIGSVDSISSGIKKDPHRSLRGAIGRTFLRIHSLGNRINHERPKGNFAGLTTSSGFPHAALSFSAFPPLNLLPLTDKIVPVTIMNDEAKTPKTLGVLLGTAPEEGSHQFGLRLAAAAQHARVQVYLYLLDDAVLGVHSASLQSLVAAGVQVSACAYAARRREIPATDAVTFGGLGLLNRIITKSDRFVGLCH